MTYSLFEANNGANDDLCSFDRLIEIQLTPDIYGFAIRGFDYSHPILVEYYLS